MSNKDNCLQTDNRLKKKDNRLQKKDNRLKKDNRPPPLRARADIICTSRRVAPEREPRARAPRLLYGWEVLHAPLKEGSWSKFDQSFMALFNVFYKSNFTTL